MLGVAKGGKIPDETSKAQFSAQILTTVPNFGPGRRRRSFSLKMEEVMYTNSFGHNLLPVMVVILRSQISVKVLTLLLRGMGLILSEGHHVHRSGEGGM